MFGLPEVLSAKAWGDSLPGGGDWNRRMPLCRIGVVFALTKKARMQLPKRLSIQPNFATLLQAPDEGGPNNTCWARQTKHCGDVRRCPIDHASTAADDDPPTRSLPNLYCPCQLGLHVSPPK